MNNYRILTVVLCAALALPAMAKGGAESSGGEPGRPYVPSEPFLYQCGLKILSQIPREEDGLYWISSAKVSFNNTSYAANFLELHWENGVGDVGETYDPDVATTPTSEKPPFDLSRTSIGLFFRKPAPGAPQKLTIGINTDDTHQDLSLSSGAGTTGLFADKTTDLNFFGSLYQVNVKDPVHDHSSFEIYVHCRRAK